MAAYTPFYCEENVYRLLSHLASSSSSSHSRSYAVFVTNHTQLDVSGDEHEQQTHSADEQQPRAGGLVKLYKQRAGSAQDDDGAVYWDYHVFALVQT